MRSLIIVLVHYGDSYAEFILTGGVCRRSHTHGIGIRSG